MIKKSLLAISMLLLFLSSAFSAITFPESLSDQDRAMLDSAIGRGISNRKDVPVSVTSFSRRPDYIRLDMTLGEKEMTISAHNDDELEDFIFNALNLEESLFLDGSTLYYVSDDIIASRDERRRGELYEAYDSEGKRRALLEVTDMLNGSAIYSPIYQKDLVAGLLLEKGPSFSLSLRALSNIAFNNFGFALDFAYLPLFKYVNPLISFYIGYRGTLSYYGGLGLEIRLPLERLIRAHFTLIEEGAIFASAMLYLGYNGAFSIAAGYNVGYEHFITPRLKWRLGWEQSQINNGAIMLSMGVLF